MISANFASLGGNELKFPHPEEVGDVKVLNKIIAELSTIKRILKCNSVVVACRASRVTQIE